MFKIILEINKEEIVEEIREITPCVIIVSNEVILRRSVLSYMAAQLVPTVLMSMILDWSLLISSHKVLLLTRADHEDYLICQESK